MVFLLVILCNYCSCNSCSISACDSVGISPTLGCTDPTTPLTNFTIDDGSCAYDCSAFTISVDTSGNVTGCALVSANGFVGMRAQVCTNGMAR